MIIAVLYDIVKNQPLSYTNEVDPLVLPERTNPDYKYFVPYEPSVKPNYDQRYYDYKMVETPKNISHPIYPLYNQWLIEHKLTKRSNDDIFLSIENARKVANATLIDYDLQAMAIAVIIKRQNNEVLTSEEIQIALDWVSISNKLIQNKQIEANKKAQVLNNQEPDIDAGWERKI
jgi:hypothetical protein